MIEIVASSYAMREVIRLAERVAATDANVLITGESGVGKDALAWFIHSHSPRASKPFVKIDCATLPRELLESELFGHERGAFTGATETRPGRLESSHKGTCILDEIAQLSTDAQAKLLRVIERREFERLGGRKTIKVDARLITLTNVNLAEAVQRKAFREDLFYRLNVVHIEVPALRLRGEDVPLLARNFLSMYASKHGRRFEGIAAATLEILQNYEFPGNVRELANVVERAVITGSGSRLEPEDLSETLRASVTMRGRGNRRLSLAEVEDNYIRETLAASNGNKSDAARTLGISRKNLYERLARGTPSSSNASQAREIQESISMPIGDK